MQAVELQEQLAEQLAEQEEGEVRRQQAVTRARLERARMA